MPSLGKWIACCRKFSNPASESAEIYPAILFDYEFVFSARNQIIVYKEEPISQIVNTIGLRA